MCLSRNISKWGNAIDLDFFGRMIGIDQNRSREERAGNMV